MVERMRSLIPKSALVLLSLLLLAGCRVASPIITTKDFLTQLQQNQWEQAAEMIVVSDKAQLRSLTSEEKQTWISARQKSLGEVKSFTVQNAVPLQEAQLSQLGSNEGYEIFFELESAKTGSQHVKTLLVKVDNSWKLLDPDLDP